MNSIGKKIRRGLRNIKFALKNPFTYITILAIISIVAATIVVYKNEPLDPDCEINGLSDAIWHTIVAVVAAYYDFYMKTVPGRLASLALLLFGMALWTIIMGKITSSIMAVQTKHNRGLKKLRKMKGHFLLCGWRPGFEKILDTIMISNPDIAADQIVLVNNAPSEQIESLRSELRFKELKYVSGDFSDAAVLKRAFADSAERALIIADATAENQSEIETDSRTVLAALTLKNLNSSIYIAAELIDEKFKKHLELARCDEIISTKAYEYSLLATASSGMGYSNVIKSLISDDADSGIIVDEIPKTFSGKSYGELAKHFDGDGEILVGLLLNSEQSRGEEPTSQNEPLLAPEDGYVIPKFSKAILVRAKKA